MGIPSFLKFLKTNIPELTAKKEDIKVDVDNLYIDFYFLVHRILAKQTLKGTLPNKEETNTITEQLNQAFEECVKLFGPKNVLYIAFEGVSPQARQQHVRLQSNLTELENIFDIKHKATVVDSWKSKGLDLNEEIQKVANQKQSIEVNQPGTEFLHDVSEAVKLFIQKKIAGDWKDLKIVFSDEKVPGESKSKIYDFIRSQVSSDNYNEDLTHFIVSSDSDNLLFSVPLFEANIFICQNPSETESIIKISEIHNFIHEKTLKEATDEETLAFIEENSIKERVFYDFVLMFLLIGNDYLPSLPNFENKLRSMYHLMECYKKFLKKQKFNTIVTEDFYISLPLLQQYIHVIALTEFSTTVTERQKMIEMQGAEYNTLKNRIRKIKENPENIERTPLQQFNYDLDILYFEQPKKPHGQAQEEFLTDESEYSKIYYKEKFQKKKIDDDFVQDLCQSYVEGILWTFEYFARGCISQNWSFKYNYAPFPSDIQNCFQRFAFPAFEKSSALTPIASLLANHSGLGKQCALPTSIRQLIGEDLQKYYPTDLKLDQHGKYYFKQAIIQNLPILNEEKLKKAVKKCEENFTDAEKARNTVSKNPRFFTSQKMGDDKIFGETDFKKRNIVGVFQRVNPENSVHAFKFKCPSKTADQLVKDIQEAEKKQLKKDKIQSQKKAEQIKQYKEQQAQEPCKFADNCRNLQLGRCKFYHTEEQVANKDAPKLKPCTQGDACKFKKQGTCKFYHA